MIRIIFLLIPLILLSFQDEEWLSEVENKTDIQAIEWLRSKMRENEAPREDSMPDQPCLPCKVNPIIQEEEPETYICMSFSIPDNIWLQLSKESESQKSVFVLRGIPDNNFQKLAQKILSLKEKGMNSSIILDPNIFRDYDVNCVPTFISRRKKSKVSGAISLNNALERLRKREISNFEL